MDAKALTLSVVVTIAIALGSAYRDAVTELWERPVEIIRMVAEARR
jgi:hypothetical protein